MRSAKDTSKVQRHDPRSARASWWIWPVLAALAITPYVQTWAHDFIVYDDGLYVTDNHIVQQGLTLAGVRWAFTAFQASNWHPVTWLSHMLDVQVFGMRPGWHHLVNVLIHTANTLALYGVWRRMSGDFWRSALVAALFAVHPLHVESVAWIAERKDVLSTFFGLAAMWCYVGYVSQRRAGLYLSMLLCFALSLMAKPMLVTLPFLLLLLDYWPLRRLAGGQKPMSLAFEKFPLLGLSVASCVITMMAQKTGGAVFTLEALPIGARIGNAVVAYAMYLQHAAWPVNLALLYPFPADGYWPAWKVIGSTLLIVAITITVSARARKQPALFVGWWWFAGTLVPVIGLVQVGMQAMADRYTYVPLIGLFIMVAWSLPGRTLVSGRWSTVVSSLAVIVLAIAATVQAEYWHDDLKLFGRTLAVTDRNFIACNNLGHAYARRNQDDQAIEWFRQALNIRPTYAQAQENLGNVLARIGRAHEAVPYLHSALQRDPSSISIHASLAGALDADGQLDQAIIEYRNALELEFNQSDVHASLALALAKRMDLPEALTEYETALRIEPSNSTVHANYGLALAGTGRLDEAIAQFNESLRLRPDSPTVRQYLSTAINQWQATSAASAPATRPQ